MKEYTLVVEGRVRETYGCVAADEAAARELFNDGSLTETQTSEVEDAEIVEVICHGDDDEPEPAEDPRVEVLAARSVGPAWAGFNEASRDVVREGARITLAEIDAVVDPARK